jgi:hypothetical protein
MSRLLKFDIYHPMSGILLRADLRRRYEAGEFVFLPVGDYWVAHFFDPTSELAKQLDQKPVMLSQEIPKAYLLVRVAIAAFALAKDFIEQGEHAPLDGGSRVDSQHEQGVSHEPKRASSSLEARLAASFM